MLGNLIVGYNELYGYGNDRTGSHNIVLGPYHNYSSYGGLVAGYLNAISGPLATVTGGGENVASGYYSHVSGGQYNEAKGGWYASVSGGISNEATGFHASVSGGVDNISSGDAASVSGGYNNQAIGDYSFVGGGGSSTPAWGNYASANYSAILGGANNTAGDPDRVTPDSAIGVWSTVSGGRDRSVVGGDDWRAGGLFQEN